MSRRRSVCAWNQRLQASEPREACHYFAFLVAICRQSRRFPFRGSPVPPQSYKSSLVASCLDSDVINGQSGDTIRQARLDLRDPVKASHIFCAITRQPCSLLAFHQRVTLCQHRRKLCCRILFGIFPHLCYLNIQNLVYTALIAARGVFLSQIIFCKTTPRSSLRVMHVLDRGCENYIKLQTHPAVLPTSQINSREGVQCFVGPPHRSSMISSVFFAEGCILVALSLHYSSSCHPSI